MLQVKFYWAFHVWGSLWLIVIRESWCSIPVVLKLSGTVAPFIWLLLYRDTWVMQYHVKATWWRPLLVTPRKPLPQGRPRDPFEKPCSVPYQNAAFIIHCSFVCKWKWISYYSLGMHRSCAWFYENVYLA